MKNLLATIALSLTSFGALAADLPRRSAAVAPAPIMAAVNWAGCSLGVAGGYGWHKSSTPRAAIGEGDHNGGSHTADAGLIGGRASCDLQYDRFVFGAQGSFDVMNMSGINVFYPNPLPEFTTSRAAWGGSATIRAGFLVTPSVLLYVRGGAAWLNIEHTDYDTGVGGPTFIGVVKSTRSGWTIGAGVEYAITGNWFANVEYNYTDLGSKTQVLDGILFPGTANISYPWRNRYDNQTHAVTVGLRYKFF